MNNNCKKFIIEKEKVLEINNKFRSLGLNQKLLGTKLLNKTIQIIIFSDNEFFILEDVFDEIIKLYPTLNKTQIRMAIKYTLDNRNENICKRNFEKIFGFEYDEDIFYTKNFIDEFVYVINYISITNK